MEPSLQATEARPQDIEEPPEIIDARPDARLIEQQADTQRAPVLTPNYPPAMIRVYERAASYHALCICVVMAFRILVAFLISYFPIHNALVATHGPASLVHSVDFLFTFYLAIELGLFFSQCGVSFYFPRSERG